MQSGNSHQHLEAVLATHFKSRWSNSVFVPSRHQCRMRVQKNGTHPMGAKLLQYPSKTTVNPKVGGTAIIFTSKNK